jgi:hypothetical protein
MIEHEFRQCQPTLPHFNSQHDQMNEEYLNQAAPVFSSAQLKVKKTRGLGMQQQYKNFQQRHNPQFEMSPLTVESRSAENHPFSGGIAGGIACGTSVDGTPLETPLATPLLYVDATLRDEAMSPDFYFHHNSTLASMVPTSNSKPTFTYKVCLT